MVRWLWTMIVPVVAISGTLTPTALAEAVPQAGWTQRVPISQRVLLPTVGEENREVGEASLATDDFYVAAVTWEQEYDSELSALMRVKTDQGWSDWLPVHPDHHEPDPRPGDDREYRAGTEPFLTRAANEVEVRVVSEPGEPLPDELLLEVIDPGPAPGAPSIAALDPMATTAAATASAEVVPALYLPEASALLPPQTAASSSPTRAVTAADGEVWAVPPQPVVRSRASWGADETLRQNYGEPIWYGEVRGAFVHHTAGPNVYWGSDVPRLIRGIYRYHVLSRDFDDIGYNFLVDRFGRIWEGAYGGIDRPVVGAHTKYYNSQSFSLSVMGDYTSKSVETEVLNAYKDLFAWKLVLHGVTDAIGYADYTNDGAERQRVISGHRDTKATACPGQQLYDKLPNIRSGTQARMNSVAADLSLAGPATAEYGTPVGLDVDWAAGELPVTGVVDLQVLKPAGWTHVRQLQVLDGAAAPELLPVASRTYRLRTSDVTSPVNIDGAHPQGTSNEFAITVTRDTSVQPTNACPPGEIAAAGFTDVSADLEPTVDCLWHWQITGGTSATRYSPYRTVTREQMAAFVARLVLETGGTLPTAPPDAFTDDEQSVFEPHINQLAAVGIVGGTGGGRYSPKDVVTRAQMAAFLTRAFDYRAGLDDLELLMEGGDHFDDDDGHSLELAINKASFAGFAVGYVDGTFGPNQAVRRDHMAAFLVRALDRVVSAGMAAVPPAP